MAWSDLTFTGCTVLTAAAMGQLQANFAALGQGAPGAPPLAPTSLMWTGQASGGALRVSSQATLFDLSVTDIASVSTLWVSSAATLSGLKVTGPSSLTQVTLSGAPPASPAAHTAYAHPAGGSQGWALPMNPASALQTLASVLTSTQGSIAAGSLEGWHEVGAAGEPGFLNSWVNFGSAIPTAAFRKLPDGMVVLKGVVKSGTLTAAAFTLPVGYRPAGEADFATAAGGSLAVLQVTSAGGVIPSVLGGGDNTFVYLYCTFFAEA